jgi:hypothetical protein
MDWLFQGPSLLSSSLVKLKDIGMPVLGTDICWSLWLCDSDWQPYVTTHMGPTSASSRQIPQHTTVTMF